MPDGLMLDQRARGAMGAGERDLRVRLAAAYRLVDHFGWTEQIYGHLTARVPGPDDYFLINPGASTTTRSPRPTWSRSTWRARSFRTASMR